MERDAPAAPGPALPARAARRLIAWRDRHPVLSLLLLLAATRALLLLAAVVGGAHLPRWAGEGAWDRGDAPWRYLARWDSAYYMGISEVGRGAQTGSWSFSPAYPMLMRAVDALPGFDVVEAGVLVSALALLACVPLAYRVGVDWFGPVIAWRASAILLLAPGGVYLSAVYPESLFLALVLTFLLALRRKWWIVAGVLASVAAVTRPQGILLPAALALALALERPRSGRVPLAGLAALPLSVALPILDMVHAHQVTGDAFVSAAARVEVWQMVGLRGLSAFVMFPMTPIQKAASLLAAALLTGALAWAFLDARRRGVHAPLEAYAFCAGLWAIMVFYADPAPSLRYLLPALVLPWALAAWATSVRRLAGVGALSFTVALLLALLFGGWYPMY